MTSLTTKNLFSTKLDLTGWERYGVKEMYVCDGTPIPGLRQEAYKRTIDNVEMSVGVFTYKGMPAYIAWGIKAEPHCSYHAPLLGDNALAPVREGCAEHTILRGADGIVSGFILDGTETFGTGVARKAPTAFALWFKKVLPIVAILAGISVLATLVNVPAHSFTHFVHEWMLDAMAGFFLIFGGLKLINIQAFAESYAKYDIIAKRFMAWGYVYAFAEVFLGVLYVTRVELLFASILTVVLLTLATVGVYQKIRKNENTQCACLGGFFNVPITWLTFGENAAMIVMALWMIATLV